MTPQEKAEDLIEQFMEHTVEWDKIKEIAFDSEFHAKQCALIAVDEMILVLPFTNTNYSLNEYAIHLQKYLKQVKHEIEKL